MHRSAWHRVSVAQWPCQAARDVQADLSTADHRVPRVRLQAQAGASRAGLTGSADPGSDHAGPSVPARCRGCCAAAPDCQRSGQGAAPAQGKAAALLSCTSSAPAPQQIVHVHMQGLAPTTIKHVLDFGDEVFKALGTAFPVPASLQRLLMTMVRETWPLFACCSAGLGKQGLCAAAEGQKPGRAPILEPVHRHWHSAPSAKGGIPGGPLAVPHWGRSSGARAGICCRCSPLCQPQAQASQHASLSQPSSMLQRARWAAGPLIWGAGCWMTIQLLRSHCSSG